MRSGREVLEHRSPVLAADTGEVLAITPDILERVVLAQHAVAACRPAVAVDHQDLDRTAGRECAGHLDPTVPRQRPGLHHARCVLGMDDVHRDGVGFGTRELGVALCVGADRCLFLVVDRCAIYCRHCNRRRLVGGDDPPTTPEIEAAAIEQLSQRLADVGLPHEAARLCGFAAVHTPIESDARRLLKHSRLFRAQRAQLKRAARVDRDVVRLSEQETRVAQLVLEGRTHREIGATLFISAKTVEHHVAHIRTKLAAGSRAEMLAAIRAYLELASSPS